MIIRTEESRAMGARFLDHADLGSQEECLRLCCETDECDVFVFEEKVNLIFIHLTLQFLISNFYYNLILYNLISEHATQNHGHCSIMILYTFIRSFCLNSQVSVELF